MTWQEVTTDVGAKIGLTKYSVALKHGGARVSVPAAVVDKLGWSESTTFKLLVGSGEASGKLRLQPTKDGKIVGRKPPLGGGGLIIRLGRWPDLAPRDVEAVSVEIEVDGDALVITLPQHARNEAPSARPAPSSTLIPVMPAGAAAAKRDVTSKFFDDPKKPPAMASGTRTTGRTF